MSDIVDKEKLKTDAGLQYLPTDLTYELRMGITGYKKDEFLSWGYQWEDKPHRLVYAACCEAEAQADTITRLTAENAKLRAALETVMIGGNSLAQIIGADHPPYGTSYDEALAHYGGGVKYEAWCCWNAIMEARAALSGDKHDS